jgi:hypothetical protein
MPYRRCLDCPGPNNLVRLEEWVEHRKLHRTNDNRGWSARNRSAQRRFRRSVLARDGHQCTFILGNGLRCPVTAPLVADHRLPLHRGGSFDPAGGVTLCEQHHREVDRYAR